MMQSGLVIGPSEMADLSGFLSVRLTKPYQTLPFWQPCRKKLPKPLAVGNLTQQFLKAAVPVPLVTGYQDLQAAVLVLHPFMAVL